jgi:peroxiredoxin
MRTKKQYSACHIALVCLAGLTFACTKSSPPSGEQAAAPERERIDREVRVARAESPVTSERDASLRPTPVEPSSAEPVSAEPTTAISSERDPTTSGDVADSAAAEPARLPLAKATIPLDEAADSELTMPRVSLTQAHAKICRVQVGDVFPDAELADNKDQKQSIAKLLGPKLTVVVFWNGKKPSARQELADLEPTVIARFADKGLAVVAINSGDDPQLAKELATQAGNQFVALTDPDGGALSAIAPGRIPATYLLDAAGKILWFDIEYSRSTRRDLSQAIRYSLKQL